MSRICVKNIGKSCNEAQLKDVFSQKGEVTDVKIIKNQKSHNSRNFAFIGFRTELQAQEAIKYFNNTYIGLSRIAVELARKLGDQDLKAEKQKHSLSAKEKLKQLKEKKNQPQQDVNPKDSSKTPEKPTVMGKNKKEFMEVVNRPGTMQKASERLEAQRAPEPMEESEAEDNHPQTDESDDDSAIDLDELVKQSAEKKDEAAKLPAKPLSDLDYLRSKVTTAWSDDEDEEDEERDRLASKKQAAEEEEADEMAEDEEQPAADDDEGEGEGEASKEAPIDGGEEEEDEARLYLRNIPYSATEDELRALGEKFGTVAEVHIPLDKPRGSRDKDKEGDEDADNHNHSDKDVAAAARMQRGNKGFGFLTFMFPQHATAALAALDGSSFQGRVLFVTRAKKQKEKEVTAVQALGSGNTRLSTFQAQKEEERRKQMLKRESWNASFVRSDAVMETIKERYGVEQSALLNTGDLKSADLAVRLAVAETQIVQENKDFFLSHGIHLDVLESVNSQRKSSQRSTTTLLVKNLPPDSDLEELESMFAKFGEIASFLVPPSRTVAVVDFIEPSEARTAFKSLAYRRYKNSPLFLEWAPTGMMTEDYERDKLKRKEQGSSAQATDKSAAQQKLSQPVPSSSSSQAQQQQQQKATGTAEDDDLADFSTLFVKNLNFSTTEPALRDFLVNSLQVQGVRAVIIQKKQKGSQLLSQGYGFVEFKNAALAQAAVAKMQGAMLDSHKLEVKPSEKRLTTAPSGQIMRQLAASKQRQTKLIVRNVAFQASKEEIRSLFAAFGSVKSVRIPKKMSGAHRGFAFVEFSTSQEALNAMTSLKSTHLYGRHLVLEWAKAEDEAGEDGAEEGAAVGGAVTKEVASLRKRAREDQARLEVSQKKKQRRAGGAGDGEDEGDEDVRAML